MDQAIQQLVNALAARRDTTRGAVLWVADEHVDTAAAAAIANIPDVHALTNRCDVATALSAYNIPTHLSDFDFDAAGDDAWRDVVFRVAKEKALVHHVINRALERLAPGGRLWLAGAKNEGIKTYIEKAAARAAGSCDIERGPIWLAQIERGVEPGDALPDQDYALLRRISLAADLGVWSKPGVFGWQKLDAGSAFLARHLSDVWTQAPQRVLDLGCGYGYLTLLAARQWPQAQFVASDNNVAAVNACERNLREFSVPGESVVADCGAGIDGGFDALLCNPPFHQGFDTESELSLRFLQAARRLLRPGGRALFVVNQFIALERRAETVFADVRVLARNASFKLVVLER